MRRCLCLQLDKLGGKKIRGARRFLEDTVHSGHAVSDTQVVR